MAARRERLLYPLRVAFLLVAGSVLVYMFFTALPIAYSIYIAFTDATAKNIAPGPRLKELEETRRNITTVLESNRDTVVEGAMRSKILIEETIQLLEKLKASLSNATPQTLSLAFISRVRGDVDSRLLEVKHIVKDSMLSLDPRIRDPLDVAFRSLDIRVWQPLDSILLYKVYVTEEDLVRVREEVIPSITYVEEQLAEVVKALQSIGEDYKGFIRSATRSLDVEIEELRLHFVGLDNFRRLFGDSRFPYSILKTVLFVTTSVPLKVAAGLVLALIFTSPLVYGRRLLRGLLLVPWALPVLLSVTTWRVMFTPERGQLWVTLKEVLGVNIDIYVNEWHAFAVYNLVEMWLAYPFVMTVTIAAIAGIPREYIEAAVVDGARGLEVFKSIVLPLILRPVAFAAILTTGASLQAFMVPLLINNGGPAKSLSLPGFPPATGYSNEMMVLYGYNRAWLDQDYGLSASAFLVVVAILLVYAIAWYYLLYRRGWSSV